MAKILFGAAISDARGSVANTVFTKSRAGPGIRQRGIPTQPNNPAQQFVRAGCAILSKRWDNVLTETFRSDWRALAILHPRTDLWGAQYKLTGLQLFIAANQALKKIGLAYIDDAPGSFAAGNVSAVTVNWTPGTQTLEVDASPAPGADDVPVIWASSQIQPGKTILKGHLTQLDYQSAGAAGPWDISADFQTRHGTFLTWRSIIIQVRYTDQISGAQGIAAQNQVWLNP